MNAAPAAAPNSRSRKIARSSIGARLRASISTNAGSSTTAEASEPITNGSFQDVIAPREIPSTSPVSPITKAKVPGRSSPRTVSGRASSRRISAPHRRTKQPERHVEPEHPRPRDRHERPTEHRPQHEPDRGDHRVGPQRHAQLSARERVRHQSSRVCEQKRPAHALQHAPQDELGHVVRKARAQRSPGEHHEATHVRALAPEEIREPPRRQDQDGRRDHVCEDHPHERQDARVQRPLEVRQGDDQRAGVDRREQHPEARARERPPLVMGVIAADAEASGRLTVSARISILRTRQVSTSPHIGRRDRFRPNDASRPRQPWRPSPCVTPVPF